MHLYPDHLQMTGRYNSLFALDRESLKLLDDFAENENAYLAGASRRRGTCCRRIYMKLTVGLGSIDQYIRFVKAGADEFFCGYVPYSWSEKYGTVLPLNRREDS